MNKKTKAALDRSILVDGKLPANLQKIYEESFAKAQADDQPMIEKLRRSRMISASGMAIVINAKDIIIPRE